MVFTSFVICLLLNVLHLIWFVTEKDDTKISSIYHAT